MSLRPRTHFVRFGVFEFDPASGDLWKNGRRIKLQKQPRQILGLLVSRPGELVTREELRRQLWPDDTFVDFDNGLNVAIRKIRDALGDVAPSPRFVETERAQGYRFIAPVTERTLEGESRVDERPVASELSAPPDEHSRNRSVVRLRVPTWTVRVAAVVLAVALVTGGILTVVRRPPGTGQLTYTQLTNFADSAIAPALSPDGRMVAFYRSNGWFLTTDDIWVKLLPSGEPVRLTKMAARKYGLSFSPDSSRIAFTVSEQPGWRTFTMSPLGDEPRLMMLNAAGLTWIDRDHILFSEVKSGLHMGIVTANADRSDRRDLYFPQHERAMAHYSHLSPDRRWVLVIEMDHVPIWQPCRVVPFDGSSAGWIVGPRGSCSAAGWSPDGNWMYFTVEVSGSSHLWRQRFPRGEPEQLTSGPNEAMGVAVFPDGRSLITSIGVPGSTLWAHDNRGERPLTSQGQVGFDFFSSQPSFSVDGRYVYYLLRRDSPASSNELWRVDVETQKSEPVVPGFSILEYDAAVDGRSVVFWSQTTTGRSQVWLAVLDGAVPPKQIGSENDASPHFGPGGEIVFRLNEGQSNYLAVMKADGSGRRKIVPYPISTLQTVSPDGQWAVAIGGRTATPGEAAGSVAIPVAGGAPRKICPSLCQVHWAPDGTFLYVTVTERSSTDAGKTLAIPLQHGEMLPTLPEGGITSAADVDRFPGARVIGEGGPLAPGPEIGTYAFVKAMGHRNLFQITLP